MYFVTKATKVCAYILCKSLYILACSKLRPTDSETDKQIDRRLVL
jgi:hypothetical protein